MKRVNVHNAKTHLSRYLSELTPDEPLVLCNRNEPVAELRALGDKHLPKPRIGVDSFFERLPDEILKAFGGE